MGSVREESRRRVYQPAFAASMDLAHLSLHLSQPIYCILLCLLSYLRWPLSAWISSPINLLPRQPGLSSGVLQ